MFATTVLAGADGVLPFGLSRLLAGVAFSLGLILVVLGGAELFTGNTLMVMAWAAGKVRLHEMLRAWLVVYVGNFIGATGTALLVFLSGQYLSGRGVVASVVLKLALKETTLPFDHALFLGILCNVLVCLAVWLTLGARSTSDKVLAVLFPVSALGRGWFRAFGRQHVSHSPRLVRESVGPCRVVDANWKQHCRLRGPTWPAFFLSLIPVTIGNIIGGGGLVGGVYWFIYICGTVGRFDRGMFPMFAKPATFPCDLWPAFLP